MIIHASISKVALQIKCVIVSLPDAIKRFARSLRGVRQTICQFSSLNSKNSGDVKHKRAYISQYTLKSSAPILESQSNRILLFWEIQKTQIAIDTLIAKCPISATSDILLLEQKMD